MGSNYLLRATEKTTATTGARVYVLEIGGDVDLDSSPALQDTLNDALGRDFKNIVVNLSAVRYLDSSGVISLVQGLRRAQMAGGDLVLVYDQVEIERLLRLTRLRQLFSTFDSVSEALTHFDARSDSAIPAQT